MKLIQRKDEKYICAYKVIVFYSDGTKQRTTKYTDPYDTAVDARDAAEKADKTIVSDESSAEKAAGCYSMCVSFGTSYVFEKRYLNYGQDAKYKMKYSVQVPKPVAHCSKQKTFYTPWLNSEQECIDYAAKVKAEHGVTSKK